MLAKITAVECHQALSPESCYKGQLTTSIKWLVALSVPCNSWLFFARIRGVYTHSRTVIVFFAMLWLSTFTSIIVPFSWMVSVNHIGGNSCSILTSTRRYLGAVPFITLVIFDTAVIIASSFRMVPYDASRGWRGRIESVLAIRNVGRVSKAFVRSGQAYYM